MENKIDKVKIERYSEKIANNLCNNYFVNEDFITGDKIVKFTPIPQINYFILENIFGNWIEETSKLESPYFDYDNQAVQDALRSFMNKLSHHIRVDRDNFEPLIIAAIRDTVNLVLSPYSFFKQEYFTVEREKITVDELKELSKYIKLNSVLINELIKDLQQFNIDVISINDLLERFNEIYNNHSNDLADVEEFVNQLNQVQPVTTNDFLKKQESINTIQPSESINQKLATPSTTLHDQLNVPKPTTIVDQQSSKKIESIPKVIGINQKYSFVNELFDGEADAYNTAIEELDSCESLDNANILINSLAQKYQWSPDNEEVQELMDIVGRRY